MAFCRGRATLFPHRVSGNSGAILGKNDVERKVFLISYWKRVRVLAGLIIIVAWRSRAIWSGKSAR
jgi:hypothetical protein